MPLTLQIECLSCGRYGSVRDEEIVRRTMNGTPPVFRCTKCKASEVQVRRAWDSMANAMSSQHRDRDHV